MKNPGIVLSRAKFQNIANSLFKIGFVIGFGVGIFIGAFGALIINYYF